MSFQETTKNLKFNFPFTPYKIQTDFSKNLFYALSFKKFSLFESPTGTGKSLSMIMGCCEWFTRNNQNVDFLYSKMNNIEEKKPSELSSDPDLPEWLNEDYMIENKKEAIKLTLEKRKEELKQRRIHFEKIKKGKFVIQNQIGQMKSIHQKNKNDDDLLDYDSEKDCSDNIDELFKNFRQEKYNNDKKKNLNQENDDSLKIIPFKIIYASRTHSQIQQFVQEIKKTEYRNLRVVTLGSRKVLCINESVNKKDFPLHKINTLCKKIKSKASEKIPKCPFFESTKDPNFSFAYLDQINDIEEMLLQGKKFGICPYYGSRNNVENAEILCVPYVSLFHKQTREKFGINLKNSIILVDEAHNLLEGISQIHSFELNFRQICQIYSQLKSYQDKYQKKLKAKNAFYINQLCLFLNNLRIFLQAKHNTNKPGTYKSMRILDFLLEINGTSLDFTKLQSFIENSQLSKKLNMFVEKFEEKIDINISNNNESFNPSEDIMKPTNNILDIFIDFFMGLLKSNDKESCFLIKFSEKLPESSLNIIRLDPENALKEVLNECHSMVLAGGTMEPISDYNFIKNIIPEDKIFHFSCGHIITDKQFKAFVVAKENEKGIDLVYNYDNKQNPELLNSTISLIKDIAKEIPEGLIIFAQSYGFLKIIEEKLKFLEVIHGKKVFFDSKNSTKLIKDYENQINCNFSGAILFSVMGGRLSEGINFNDKLARGIIVLGLPFSNIQAPEVIEKAQFFEKRGINYKENACMKLVNQTIGRAIRHKNDYAIVFLVDKRFEKEGIKEKLPSWIKEYIEPKNNLNEILPKLKLFFHT